MLNLLTDLDRHRITKRTLEQQGIQDAKNEAYLARLDQDQRMNEAEARTLEDWNKNDPEALRNWTGVFRRTQELGMHVI